MAQLLLTLFPIRGGGDFFRDKGIIIKNHEVKLDDLVKSHEVRDLG